MADQYTYHTRCGTPLEYTLIRSPRRRTLSIEVHRDRRLKVRAPSRVDLREIESLLEHRSSWIIEKLRACRPELLPSPLLYESGEAHWYLGQAYPLQLQTGPKRVWLDTDTRTLQVRHRDSSPASIRQVLAEWYRTQAERTFSLRLDWWRSQLSGWRNLPSTIHLRHMRKTWGSCTAKGKITLNTQAIKLDIRLIDYILSHEICHLREMNHSPAFYAWHEQILPDYRERRQALRAAEPEALRE